VTIPTQRDAKETLEYIRQTMESASTFTAVSGWGLVIVGALGLVAASLAWAGGTPADLRVWIPAAIVSVGVATGANVLKARRMHLPIWSGVMQKIAWVMAPTLLAGAMLTFSLAADGGAQQLLPGMWLALYGAGVTAGGTFSVRAIRWMGMAFLVLGGTALARPDLGLLMLVAGFGGLHVAVGLDVVWRHGG